MFNYGALISKGIWTWWCNSRMLNRFQLACQLCLTGNGCQVVAVLRRILSLVKG